MDGVAEGALNDGNAVLDCEAGCVSGAFDWEKENGVDWVAGV